MRVVSDDAASGITLARAYFHQVVEPIMSDRFAELPYAAARVGSGSDVLGLDDATSRDHDWGLRLSLFVPGSAIHEVDAELERCLPATFRGLPTRFAFTGETAARHRVEVGSVSGFANARLGFDPRVGMSVRDWLSLSGQAVLEVIAGPVFTDRNGELDGLRQALAWYPDDVWRYVLASGWVRLEQELPLMGRAADTGDELGSRIIAARLTQVVMHLAFMIERRWPPYAKWFGTLFHRLPCAAELAPCLGSMLGPGHGARQDGFAAALDALLKRQNALGLTEADVATVPFWDRPYLHPSPDIVSQLMQPVADPAVRALPPGRGSIEQRTDSVDVLVDPEARWLAVAG